MCFLNKKKAFYVKNKILALSPSDERKKATKHTNTHNIQKRKKIIFLLPLGEGDAIGSHGQLVVVADDGDLVGQVASLAVHLDAVVQEGLLQKDKGDKTDHTNGWDGTGRTQDTRRDVCA